MHHPIFSSLRARVLWLIAASLLPWLAIVVYHVCEERELATTEAIADSQRLANTLALQQDQAIVGARNLMQLVATLPEARFGPDAACRSRIQAIHAQSNGYINLGVADAQGRILCAAREGDKVQFRDRDWYQEMLKQPRFVVGRYVIGKISGKPILPVAYPILDGQGKLARIVFASLDVAWLEQSLRRQQLVEGERVSLVDYQGVVVARHPQDGKAVGRAHGVAWLVESITAGRAEGSGEAIERDGERRLLAFAHVPSSGAQGVYISVSHARYAVLSKITEDFEAKLAILALLTALMLAAGWVLTDVFVLRKVRALAAAAKRIAAGDFGARVEIGAGRGELAELTRVFDDMAGSLEKSFLQTQRIMEVAPEAIIMADANGRIVMSNARTENLFGYSREELIGQPIEMLVPADLRVGHVRNRQTYAETPKVRDMGAKGLNLTGQRKDGSVFPVDISLGPLKTEQGLWVVAAVRDVSERRKFEAEILHQATHDALTGLPNRTLFRELLSHGLTQSERAETLLAVLFLDLDGFKNINDTLGHAVGDELLKAVAKRIVGALRKDDVVARQGGDEFTIMLQGVHVVQDISLIADKLLEAVAKPYVADGREMHVTASIGITVFPFDDNDVDSLLRNADTAMYQAKESGKNAFRFYTAEMNAAIRERMEIENGLRRALREGEFVLYYQPQINLLQGKAVGVEALIRWQHPTDGLVLPGKFISVAEETGLIEPIGEWVLRTACRQIMTWRAAGRDDIRVAVNLSPRQFHRPNLLDTIRGILVETGVDACPGLLELELTESMMMREVEKTMVTLNGLRAMGLTLSVDDFGTGYSSLSYLKRFPISTLKIDRSFITGLADDPDDAAIASAVVTLAHSLKLNVIAEGVETSEQLRWLRQIGCDEVQGYYFGRPLPVEALEILLRDRERLCG